ncbi:hypothetical protein K8R30_03415 [archaeon]|nr:hypothetical protein [archaeon]
MRKNLIIGIMAIVSLVVIFAVYFSFSGEELISEKSCDRDADCECGVHVETRECFYGNKDYVDSNPAKACPDFCAGIDGSFEIRCVENLCRQVSE